MGDPDPADEEDDAVEPANKPRDVSGETTSKSRKGRKSEQEHQVRKKLPTECITSNHQDAFTQLQYHELGLSMPSVRYFADLVSF